MLDDGEDKIRRNLLLYCSAILVGIYLDIDVKNFVSIQGVDFKTVDGLKLHVLSMMTLVYLMLRFSHTQEYINVVQFLKDRWKLRPELVRQYVVNASNDYELHGRDSPGGKIFDWAWFDEVINGYPGVRHGKKISVQIDCNRIVVNPGDCQVGIQCIDRSTPDSAVLVGIGIPVSIPFALPKRFALFSRTIFLIRCVSDDKKFVVSVLPVVLAISAQLSIVIRIFRLIFLR